MNVTNDVCSGMFGCASTPYRLANVTATLLLIVPLSCIAAVMNMAFFHPLSRFPGPRIAPFSNVHYILSYMRGRQPFDILKLHEKYGPIVRIAPNELSFSSPQSLKDIYGTRPGHATFIKSSFYDGGNFANQAHSIVSERDPVTHNEMRRFLSSAFSDRSLREQEHLVSQVIDEFIEQVGIRGSKPEGIDMSLWMNILTFDIIGELAFGQSFGGIRSGKLHFWISVVLESMGQAGLSEFIRRFPVLGRIYLKINPGWLEKLVAGSIKHESYTIDLVNRRIKRKTDRKDFMSYLLKNRDETKVSDIQLAAHASDFVIAGSETTATAMATATYYLCRHKEILTKLQKEVRSAFQDYSEINGSNTSSLRYLHAVCLEALRIYSPLPLGLPRVVPPGGDTVDGIFLPSGTIVSTNPFAASMSSDNFKDPWKFDPERWLDPHTSDQLEGSQPFSLGTRVCLGRGLAWLEMRTTLAKLHFSYDIDFLASGGNWHDDSEMHLLWKKPPLVVKATPRRVDEAEARQ